MDDPILFFCTARCLPLRHPFVIFSIIKRSAQNLAAISLSPQRLGCLRISIAGPTRLFRNQMGRRHENYSYLGRLLFP